MNKNLLIVGAKVCNGEVLRKMSVNMSDFFMNKGNEINIPRGPIEMETFKYSFEDGM